MENINDLIGKLRPIDQPGQRNQGKLGIRIIDKTYNTPDEKVKYEEITQYTFDKDYIKVRLTPDPGGITYVYIHEETSGSLVYYVKQIITENNEEVIQYKQISNYVYEWEVLPETIELTEVPIYLNNQICYDKAGKKLCFYTFQATVATSPGFIFPKRIHKLNLENNRVYTMDYTDYEGYGTGWYDTIIKWLVDGTYKSITDSWERAVKLDMSTREGTVFWYPKLLVGNNKYYVTYHYMKAETGFMFGSLFDSPFQLETYPLQLTFKSIYGFLAFINCTQFYDKRVLKSHLRGHSSDQFAEFFNKYVEIVKAAYRERENTSDELYKLLYFIPAELLHILDKNKLWKFLKKVLSEWVTNNGINKEDVVISLVRFLAKREKNKDFLNNLITLKSEGKTLLYWLQNRLNGQNYDDFLHLIWDVWKKSPYANIDPEKNTIIKDDGHSPLFLPYKSDKTLGFHHDNASIDWSAFTGLVRVETTILTGKYDISILRAIFNPTQLIKFEEEKEYFRYHPYAPIVLVDEDNPHFIYKDRGNTGGFTKLPAFVMLAREEAAFWKNVVTAAEYAVDVLTTISGFGNIIKAGRLFKLLKAGKTIAFRSKAATQFATGAKAFAGTVEISSGVINGILRLTGANDTAFGRALSEYLFYLEVISLSGEISVAIHGALKKTAVKALDQTNEIERIVKGAQDTISKTVEGFNEALNQAKEALEAFRNLVLTAGHIGKLTLKTLPELSKALVNDLIELGVEFWEVNKAMAQHLLPEFFGAPKQQFAIANGGRVEMVVTREGKPIFAGTRKHFDEFADRLKEAYKNGQKKGVDEFLENAVEEHKRFLNFGDELGTGAKFDYSTIPAIVKQIRQNKGYEKFECIIVDRNNQEYRKLFQAWQKDGGKSYGVHVPIYADKYKGVPVKGPKVLFFVGETFDGPIKHVSKHTAQHEFWHVEMHIQLIHKLGNEEKYRKLIANMPTHIKEEYVTHRFLKTRSKAMDIDEIEKELRVINKLRASIDLDLLDKNYLKHEWDLRKELKKHYNIRF